MRQEQTQLGLSFKLLHRLGEVSLAGCGGLAVGYWPDQTVLSAVREAFEVLLRFWIFGKRLRQLRRDPDVARLRIELDIDFNRVSGGDVGVVAHLLADAEHEGPAHRRDGAAIRVAVDRDPNERPLG